MTITMQQKTIYGEKIRTQNTNMNEIMNLWGKVLEKQPKGEIYAVYYNFESNHTGEYDFLIGTITDNYNSSVIIKNGSYIKIEVPTGQTGIGVAWQSIWNDENLERKRAYQTDYEVYHKDGTASIYLSIMGND